MIQNTKLPTSNLRIIPLGGQEEVGKNMTVFEYKNDIIIVDMGIQFPEEDMPGVDYVIPNISYLRGKEKNVKGVVFTHGHMDHIGAAHILLNKLGYPPVIGRDLTLALLKSRLEDHQKGSTSQLKTIQVKSGKEQIKLGEFNLNFFEVEHSIMDSIGVVLTTPVATAIHMGDWTLGSEDSNEKQISYSHLANLPKPTILLMESLGSLKKKDLITEKEMWANFESIINKAPGRVIIGTFSTQVKRIRDIFEYARTINKKIAIDGYSMKVALKIAMQLGYIKAGKGTLIDIKQANNYRDNQLIILCTGAQGESRAVLTRIVTGEHPRITLKKSDTIIFSSSIIPGNEKAIQRLKDSLYRKCDNVIHNEIMNVHVSGHNNIEAIKELIKQIKPDYLLPVYANHYFLKEAKNVAKSIGFNEKNIFILDNGHIINFNKNNAPFIEAKKVDTSYVMVDGLGVGDVGQIVLRDRNTLSQDGMFVIVAIVDRRTGKVKGSPDIISRGFVYLKESKELLYETRKKTVEIINKSSNANGAVNWSYVKDGIRNRIGDFLYAKTERRPMILPVIIEV
ncbi:MAG: ribonuclease J [Candidatus Nealsonbacteria bacterium]|nr:ribonuclease J [Candidatus Nealsonbacteria bacterium]